MSAPLSKIYSSMLLIRRVEEEVARVYHTDVVKSPVHLSIGQESVAVGVCEALAPGDVIFPTYRGHAAYLAKGGDLNAMVAELYGKATGCAKGKGGSMHLIDLAAGVMGCSAIVATGLPQAIGYAYAMRMKKLPVVTVCFFGDGAVEEGAFHESLNFAALKSLPILFVCENNGYAVHSRRRARQPDVGISALASGYGIPTTLIEGGDVLKIYSAALKLTGEIRSTLTSSSPEAGPPLSLPASGRAGERNGGPQFLECMTYRWKEHVGPGEDYHYGYRDREESAPWMAADQIGRIAGMLEARERAAIEADVEAKVAGAFRFAEESPFPPPEALMEDVYA